MTKAMRPGLIETWIGLTILFILILIFTGVFLKQFRFNPAVDHIDDVRVDEAAQTKEIKSPIPLLNEKTLATKVLEKAQTKEVKSAILVLNENTLRNDLLEQAALPHGIKAMGEKESFNRETLSDKIDGKAEMYLQAGFVSLQCRRFVRESDEQAWMEIFLYDMEAMRNAFAAFSLQMREDAEKLDVAEFAYKTQNAVYFLHGKYYVELISSLANEEMIAIMLQWTKSFMQTVVAGREKIPEIELFPPENLVKSSITLQPTSAFGCEHFDDIFSASYKIDETTSTVFLSLRKNPREAQEMATRYREFLMANGGVADTLAISIPEVRAVNLFNTWEVIFTHKNLVAGVHQVENKAMAEKLAIILQKIMELGSESR